MNKLFLSALTGLFFASNVYAQGMIGQIIGNGQNSTSGATRYLGLSSGGGAWNTTESALVQVMPIAATISTTRVCLSGTSGTGSRIFTVRKNSVDTSITANITNATCSADTTNTVTVVAGDLVTLKQVTSGTLNSTRSMWAIKIQAANANEFPMLMSTMNQVGAGQTRYHDLQGDFGGQFTEQYTQYIFPTSGTLDKMYIKTDANAATSTLVTTLRINNVDTALATTLSAGNSTQNNVSDVVPINAGDIASLKFVNNGSANLRVAVGMRFRPTVDGESIAGYNSNSNLSQATTSYSTAMGAGTTLDPTEANVKQLVLAGTLKKLYGATYSNLGGSGQTMTTIARKNSADTALTCAINSGTKVCSDYSDTISLVDDDQINFSYTNSATTGSSQPYGAMVISMPQESASSVGSSVLLLGAG
jgi:hypothetical protein